MWKDFGNSQPRYKCTDSYSGLLTTPSSPLLVQKSSPPKGIPRAHGYGRKRCLFLSNPKRGMGLLAPETICQVSRWGPGLLWLGIPGDGSWSPHCPKRTPARANEQCRKGNPSAGGRAFSGLDMCTDIPKEGRVAMPGLKTFPCTFYEHICLGFLCSSTPAPQLVTW